MPWPPVRFARRGEMLPDMIPRGNVFLATAADTASRIPSRASTQALSIIECQIQVRQNEGLSGLEISGAAAPWTRQIDCIIAMHAAGNAAHDDDAVAERKCLLDIVGHEQLGRPRRRPDGQ